MIRLGLLSTAMAGSGLTYYLMNHAPVDFLHSKFPQRLQRSLFFTAKLYLPEDVDDQTVLATMERSLAFIKDLPTEKIDEFNTVLSLFEKDLLTKFILDLPSSITTKKEAKNFMQALKHKTEHLFLDNDLFHAHEALKDILTLSYYSTYDGHQASGFER